MTTLEDKAETPENPTQSIEDAAETDVAFRIQSMELVEADEVGTDEYPQYGDWLPVTEVRDGLDTTGETVYVECPGGLARALVRAEVEEGDVFEVVSVQKSNGEWRPEVDAR